MVETDEKYHNGYGYMRSGETDTALYYQGDRGVVKLINENTADRSRGMGRTKFEMEDNDDIKKMLATVVKDYVITKNEHK